MDLHLVWFGLIGVLMYGYAVLDGFDLGVGILMPFVGGDQERRVLLNSIGPLWDGNEVWLVTFGGALFAVFPEAYATIFSGFYVAFMMLLAALIFRAVSIEFRSKHIGSGWRNVWDWAFFLSSFVATLLFGVATGNILIGVPIGADHEFIGSFWTLLRPFPILTGLLVVSMFALHGAIYLYLKTEDELHGRIKRWMWTTFYVFLALFVLTSVFALIAEPQVLRNFHTIPIAWIVPVLNVFAIANIARAIYVEKPLYAFVSSCASFAAFVFLLGMALFPNLVPSSVDPAYNLTIFNAAASQKTMATAGLIALIGMPLVLTYTSIVYWVFRGKVKMGEFSY